MLCCQRDKNYHFAYNLLQGELGKRRPIMLRMNIGTRKQYLVILVYLFYCHIKSIIRVIGQFVGSYSIPDGGELLKH